MQHTPICGIAKAISTNRINFIELIFIELFLGLWNATKDVLKVVELTVPVRVLSVTCAVVVVCLPQQSHGADGIAKSMLTNVVTLWCQPSLLQVIIIIIGAVIQ